MVKKWAIKKDKKWNVQKCNKKPEFWKTGTKILLLGPDSKTQRPTLHFYGIVLRHFYGIFRAFLEHKHKKIARFADVQQIQTHAGEASCFSRREKTAKKKRKLKSACRRLPKIRKKLCSIFQTKKQLKSACRRLPKIRKFWRG